MLGAYVAYHLIEWLPTGIFPFWMSVIVAALIVGLVGVVIEVLVLRRIYHAPELFQLVATFGFLLTRGAINHQ
jgi:branched-chain amino acid transport system permease protein